jgi:hypothetical protein
MPSYDDALERPSPVHNCTAASKTDVTWELSSFSSFIYLDYPDFYTDPPYGSSPWWNDTVYYVGSVTSQIYVPHLDFIMVCNIDTTKALGKGNKETDYAKVYDCTHSNNGTFGNPSDTPVTTISFNPDTGNVSINQTWNCDDGNQGQ